jgi:hypothetical protein
MKTYAQALVFELDQLQRDRVAVQQILAKWRAYWDWLDHAPPEDTGTPHGLDNAGWEFAGQSEPWKVADWDGLVVFLPHGYHWFANNYNGDYRQQVPRYLRDYLVSCP